MMVIIFIALLFVFYILNTNAFRNKINYANAFLLLWCLLSMLSTFGLYGFYVPPTETYLYIILMIIVFEFGTLFFRRVKMGSTAITSWTIEDINWNLMLLVSLACFIIMIPFFVTSIRYALTNGFYYLRLKILNNEIITARNRVIIQDIIQPLIIVTTLSSLYELVEQKKFKSVTVISIINCALYMLTLGNRWLLMEVLYLIIVLLVSKYALNIITIIKRNKGMTRIGIVLVAGMLFITSQRSIRGSTGFIYDVYSYFVGSIHLFGVAVGNPTTFALSSSDYLYGSEFFSAVLGFINDVAAAFGKGDIVQPGMTVINEITQEYYFVSPETHMNNNITMVYGFMRDGGILGIIIDSILLSLIYMKLYKGRNGSVYSMMMYYFALSLLPFLIFEWFYGRTYVLMVFIILAILSKVDKHSHREEYSIDEEDKYDL